MELGQRLKQARLDAGLSQRQLCGDEITRNMLSQIENGSARPSMDTLQYLAARLGKSVSYFLEETAVSTNQNRMVAARNAFLAGKPDQVLSALQDYQLPDEVFDQEYYFLRCLTLLDQAEQESDPQHAAELLEKAKESGSHTAYYTPELERRRLLCLAQIAPDQRHAVLNELPIDDRELLLRAEDALDRGDHLQCTALLDAARDHTSGNWLLLQGDAARSAGDLENACRWYQQAEKMIPTMVYPRLEQLYLTQEDYKMAYEYACKQRK